ncbi:MAG: hypothetical protein V4665_01110 [Patescibacteria group bacterium]
MALQRNRSIIKKIDRVISTIWDIAKKNSTPNENIVILEISEVTGISPKEVSLCLHLISDYGQYVTGSISEQNTRLYTAIQINEDINVYYRYSEFPEASSLLALDEIKNQTQPQEYFKDDEILTIGWQLDRLREEFKNGICVLQTGQEIIWTDNQEDIAEMKIQLSKLSKKNWFQLFIGKLFSKGIDKLFFEPLFEKIKNFVDPAISGLLN